MSQILNGSEPYITEQLVKIVLLNSMGQEITTGIQVLNGTPAEIADQCMKIIFINPSGQNII